MTSSTKIGLIQWQDHEKNQGKDPVGKGHQAVNHLYFHASGRITHFAWLPLKQHPFVFSIPGSLSAISVSMRTYMSPTVISSYLKSDVLSWHKTK